MQKKLLFPILLLLSLSLACSISNRVGSELLQGSNDASSVENTVENGDGDGASSQSSADGPGLPLATPYAQSPAAGICAEFDGEWVTITIRPDIPDPRCAAIRDDQMLEVINQREETLVIKIGYLEVELAPGESHKFEVPFGEYLAPGVHAIQVQPCCGAELVLP